MFGNANCLQWHPDEGLTLVHIQDLITRGVISVPHHAPGFRALAWLFFLVEQASALRQNLPQRPIMIVVGNDGTRIPCGVNRVYIVQPLVPHRQTA